MPSRSELLAWTPYSWQSPYELKLFGDAFKEARFSSLFTFSPDLVARAVFDRSLNSWLRGEPKLDQAFSTWLRGATGKNKLSATTKKTIQKTLQEFLPPSLIPPDVMRQILNGDDVAEPGNDVTVWAVVFQGVEVSRAAAGKTDEPDFLYEIVRALADSEKHGEQLTQLAKQGNAEANRNLKSLLEEDQDAWHALEPRFKHFLLIPREQDGSFHWKAYEELIRSQMNQQSSKEWAVCLPAFVLVDVALKTLALAECRVRAFESQPAEHELNVSLCDELLEPQKCPVGHWLTEVCGVYACGNLSELATELLRRRNLYNDKPIDHNLLRTWSSVKGLMPRRAMQAVLAETQPPMKNWLMPRFYMARCFSFLCDFLRANIIGNERPSWDEVQVFLRERFRQVYRLQLASPVSKG